MGKDGRARRDEGIALVRMCCRRVNKEDWCGGGRGGENTERNNSAEEGKNMRSVVLSRRRA